MRKSRYPALQERKAKAQEPGRQELALECECRYKESKKIKLRSPANMSLEISGSGHAFGPSGVQSGYPRYNPVLHEMPLIRRLYSGLDLIYLPGGRHQRETCRVTI